MTDYAAFLEKKSKWQSAVGIEHPTLPDYLFDFQKALVEWALRIGRGAIFADCGLGKTAMQLAWADHVCRHTNKHVLILTPLAVGAQTLQEARKFCVEASRSRDGNIHGSPRVWISNYEQLHKFDCSRFSGVVCDESSCIKDFKSARKSLVVEFMRQLPFRLLCTATAAPNDFWELGTSSEALGYMGFRDMVTAFFKQETTKEIHGWGRTKYRFRGHAERPFWSWVVSWSRSVQRPSDLGFSDERFVLPPLKEVSHVVQASVAVGGRLFSMPAQNLQEEREERRATIRQRCEAAVSLVEAHDGLTAVWGQLNDECDELESMLPDSRQVKGSMPDEQKEEYLLAFAAGQLRHLICKPKIGAWGMNFQACHNMVIFPSHSFEQYYQVVRRCYRFGQTHPVSAHLVLSEGEEKIAHNLLRKKHQVEQMFRELVAHMGNELRLVNDEQFCESVALPTWL